MPESEPPTPVQAHYRNLTYQTVGVVLHELLHEAGLRVSPLGASWSRDVDAYVETMPATQMLVSAGWIPLDALLTRLGYPSTGRWAVVSKAEVVGAVDIETTRPPHPVEAVLARARRQGQLGTRELAELEALARMGHSVPAHVRAHKRSRFRALKASVHELVRPRLFVELTGADSCTIAAIAGRVMDDLHRAGVPATSEPGPSTAELTRGSWDRRRGWSRPRGVVLILQPFSAADRTPSDHDPVTFARTSRRQRVRRWGTVVVDLDNLAGRPEGRAGELTRAPTAELSLTVISRLATAARSLGRPGGRAH